MFTKGQSGELAWVTSSNIPSPLKWFLGPFSDFASSPTFEHPFPVLSHIIIPILDNYCLDYDEGLDLGFGIIH